MEMRIHLEKNVCKRELFDSRQVSPGCRILVENPNMGFSAHADVVLKKSSRKRLILHKDIVQRRYTCFRERCTREWTWSLSLRALIRIKGHDLRKNRDHTDSIDFRRSLARLCRWSVVGQRPLSRPVLKVDGLKAVHPVHVDGLNSFFCSGRP